MIEQWNKVRSINISQHQLPGEGDYATVERQSFYDDHGLTLCCVAILNAWDRAGEVGMKIESFTNVNTGPKESLYRFLIKIDFISK